MLGAVCKRGSTASLPTGVYLASSVGAIIAVILTGRARTRDSYQVPNKCKDIY